jgi:4a-hydroxytetrahydrobiopterin dehydratase
MPRLGSDEIGRALAEIPEWQRTGDEIIRELRLPTFSAAIALVDRIAALAEEADHHPDIDIRYRLVRLALSTHDEGGLTEKDFELARRIEELPR